MNNSSANTPDRNAVHWYVTRCHNRSLSKVRQLLAAKGKEVFVPESYRIIVVKGKKVKRLLPVFSDLVFVKESYNELKRLMEQESVPMIFYFSHTTHVKDDAIWVKDGEMEVFMKATHMYDRNPEVKYFGEIQFKKGDMIKIIDGPLEGAVGHLVQIKRGQKKQLVLELSNMITVNLAIDNHDLIEKMI